MNKLHLDFETYCELDIKKVGAHRYTLHPSAEVLMCSYALDTEVPKIWVPAEGEEIPRDLEQYLFDMELGIHAFNAPFERLVFENILKIRFPIERFHCVMVHAWSLGFSGGLADVSKQMGLSPDKQKLAIGQKLIQKFCKPAPKNHKADRYTHENAPDDWETFKQYCKQDVVSEREIEHLLSPYPLPESERQLWFLDQRINDRGVPIDTAVVDGACKIEREEKHRLIQEMNRLTGLENANSGAQLLPWLSIRGYHLPNLQKETIEDVIKRGRPGLEVEVLKLKAQASKTSTTKWHSFKKAVCDDGRLRGMFQFGGAQRTQRWAGRIVQLHNLKRNTMDNPDQVAGILACGNRDVVEAIHGDVIAFLSETIRCAITAPEDRDLVISDLGSIESRGLGYLSGCRRINETFAKGLDTYKDFATELFQVSYDQVTKDQRTLAKPPTLGCGYRLGGEGLVKYADSMGIEMDLEFAKHAVKLYRNAFPEVVDMWYWLDEACERVVEEWSVEVGYGVRIWRDENFMFVELMSGRKIAYYQPLILMKTPPWEMDKPVNERRKKRTLTYMGMNQYTHKWERLVSHGGKITENIVQAFARDILGYHMQLVEDPDLGVQTESCWFGICLHVHDELGGEVLADQDNVLALDSLKRIMSTTPPWAPGLLLGAEGFITKRYKKD